VAQMLFSDVLYSGPLSTYNDVNLMFKRFNIVMYSMKHPSDIGDNIFPLVGYTMMQKLINSQQKRGVYHLVIENPIRIQQAVFNAVNMCTIVKNDRYRMKHEMYNLCINPKSQVPSGLYECSVTLKVSDPNWDVFPFISFDDDEYKRYTCPECHGELTLTVMRCVGPFPKEENSEYQLNLALPESVKNFISEFKKTFEIA
jgi:hypothetical protein